MNNNREPLTNEWLYAIGFTDDKTGCPTLSALHIRLPAADLPVYACVRSFPIPVPRNRGEVRELCRLLGIQTLERDRKEAAYNQSMNDLVSSGGIVDAP